jgi:hypothetical protein
MFFFFTEKVAGSLTPSGCTFFFCSLEVARGGGWHTTAASRLGWNWQLQGVVANIYEGELILCFANIQFFLQFFEIGEVSGLHKNGFLCYRCTQDTLTVELITS